MRVVNKKAHFNYELGEKIEVGIELTGAEVKSTKLGQVEMSGAYVKLKPNRFGKTEAWVTGLQIFPYKHADNTGYDSMRARRLLLHQKEIVILMSKMKQSGRLLVPTAIYTRGAWVKVELALARGKKKYEKREKIKKRDLERESK